jgi:small subunit ribosomal protein S18
MQRKRRREGEFRRRRECRFCADKIDTISYRDEARLKRFVTERGKIIPRRTTGNCARHQRIVTQAIKRARTIALLPYSPEHYR